MAPLCKEAGAPATLPDLVHVHEFAAALLGVPPSDAAVAQVDDGTNSKFERLGTVVPVHFKMISGRLIGFGATFSGSDE